MKRLRSLFPVFLIMILSGCNALPSPAVTVSTMKTFRFLALGDSYTIGESVRESERWPVQLAALLEQHGLKAELSIIARTGWTTNELWQGIQQADPQGSYDLVSLLIGVNDQYRGGDANTYRKDFRFLLGKAIAYAA